MVENDSVAGGSVSRIIIFDFLLVSRRWDVMSGEKEPEDSLRQAFENRWRNLKKRSEGKGLEMPNKEKLWRKVKKSWEKGFRCKYCKRKMEIKDKLHLRSFSLEHRKSIDAGGDNSLENIEIACGKCNMVKGTLDAKTFRQLINGKKVVPAGLSFRISEYFKLNEDGWSSDYESIDKLLHHLARKSKSEATRENYLQQIKSFCVYTDMNPDELIRCSKEEVEKLVQEFTDTYNTEEYSPRTANNVLAVLKSFFKTNGFIGANALYVERYHSPTRYRKTDEYIPPKNEIYDMADSAPCMRDKAIILTLYSTGLRNSTLRVLRYKDLKDELLKGLSNLKVPVYPEMKRVISAACKNSLPYYTFTCSEATDAIKLYLQERTDEYGKIEDEDPLFASKYNQVSRELRSSKFITQRQVQKVVKTCAKFAGISEWKDVKPQTLRKAYHTVIQSETVDGKRLDPKDQEFLMGHTLEGSQDNYFDPTRVEELRAEYSKLKFGRVVVGNKFERLQRVVAEAFKGTGEDPNEVMKEYMERKKRLREGLEEC